MVKIDLIAEKSPRPEKDCGYTSEEGMRIAREFTEENLARCGNEFRLIAISGSIARGEGTDKDIDIAVVGKSRITDNPDHPIYEIARKYAERRGIYIDVVSLFPKKLMTGRCSEMYKCISLGFLKHAIALYENPSGYLERLGRRFENQFDNPLVY